MRAFCVVPAMADENYSLQNRGALTYSGNKLIHAIISLCGEVNSEREWDELVKGRIFHDLLAPLGADANTANPARFSRFPGFLRNGKLQKLMYINANPSANGIFA